VPKILFHAAPDPNDLPADQPDYQVGETYDVTNDVAGRWLFRGIATEVAEPVAEPTPVVGTRLSRGFAAAAADAAGTPPQEPVTRAGPPTPNKGE
jgi:hypothetical protein